MIIISGNRKSRNVSKFLKISMMFLFVFISTLSLNVIFANNQNNFVSQNVNNNEHFANKELEKTVSVPNIKIKDNDGGDYTDIIINSAEEQIAVPKITTRAAFAMTIKNGETAILFEKNKNEKLPVASLTKLMTALIVLENYDLDREITVSADAIMEEGEQGKLKDGQVISVKNLLHATLIESSNRAAYALAESIGIDSFVDLMNQRASELGLTNTYFADAAGLNPQSRSTAEDIANLSKYLFENYLLFQDIISKKNYDLYLSDGSFHHKIVNTNKMLGEMDIIGGKTGWTAEARGCFMAIRRNGNNGDYSIFVVLGADDRFGEMKKLINGNIE